MRTLQCVCGHIHPGIPCLCCGCQNHQPDDSDEQLSRRDTDPIFWVDSASWTPIR